jgi:predicted GNAT family acetyltransferase
VGLERVVIAVVHESPAAFLDRAKDFLQATALENNVLSGIAHRAVSEPGRYPQGVWCATLETNGVITGAALMTPPFPILVSLLPSDGVEALLRVLGGSDLSGVIGPEETVRRLSARLGAKVALEQRQRLYALREKPGAPALPGRMRAMGPDDRALGLEWLGEFDREIGERRGAKDRALALDLGLPKKQYFLWEERSPVSMASRIETPPDGCRIGSVYTPPDHRRRGYAGAIVAGLSRLSFEEGRAWCCLFTDLANPTSNSIYPRIGYRPVRDALKVEFAGAIRV